ncbi:MAG: tRNA pseudouridine(55) synthase TruB [Candidatus Margulisiibacteriota bacterium]|nr:tRNA pseudouridine(55) synthase TruB [Candidatus Margulisiibacteriota bacterium]
MTGFLLVNKPTGITSYDAIRAIKKYLPKKTKIGHSGTLDPFATGLLIIAIGRDYTKQLNKLLNLDKCYDAEITFGIETDSYDIDGTVTNEHTGPINLTIGDITESLTSFKGEIKQMPPAFSAKKINGIPAYKLARKGEQTQLKSNQVVIYKITLKDDQLSNNKVSVSIHCSKGTYIRSIAHDLGKKLNVGAHLSKLNRTAIGTNLLEKAVDLATISETNLDQYLISELNK